MQQETTKFRPFKRGIEGAKEFQAEGRRRGRIRGYTVAVRISGEQSRLRVNFAEIPYDVLERVSTRITLVRY
ncbi:MAG: hypothetical protein DRJ97_04460 [Thermoprotei archaeon]|nr:MAG: hypothetical protein DRJ97_04460 [Thermoprotei archaeon]